MYDKKYAESWIKDYEPGKDVFREKHIMPFLKGVINSFPDDAKILDVGCGWGIAIPYLRKEQSYFGVDVTTDFFDYLKSKYPDRNLNLEYGGFPDMIGFDGEQFDLIICSMSLHTVSDWKLSIKHMFSKLKDSGKLVIVDFSEGAVEPIMARFRNGATKEHCKGLYTLDCGLEVECEIFFHNSSEVEDELGIYGSVVKKDLGPVFVGYIVSPSR